MTIVPLQPWATNSTFFYLYVTQFSKFQHYLYFTCMPLISEINKSVIIFYLGKKQIHFYLEKTNSFLFRPKKTNSFLFRKNKFIFILSEKTKSLFR
jgi:hypothetical protein